MSIVFKAEKWFKEKLFDCQACGQCVLSNTEFICPMNCPKGLRNGPCGGTLNGKCEVIPEMDCVWTTIEAKKNHKKFDIHLPLDRGLLNTSSYVNLLTGKDRETRLSHHLTDTRHIPSSSDLYQKIITRQFVMTFEIASPKTTKGLAAVAKKMKIIAPYVDAVNTTTNAGGIPSLHSTETASVVHDYGIEPIIQFCGRDHDQADFLRNMDQALEKGYKNYLLLTGDWLPQTERGISQHTWFPMDSSQMIYFVNERLHEFNERYGIVPFVGCASNQFSTPLQVSVDRLALKRTAGARFTQTQAITDAEGFGRWYKLVRTGREHEPKLTIPSVPIVGSLRLFNLLKALPGVYISPEFEQVITTAKDIPRASFEWALKMIADLKGYGAAGVHIMNFGMPLEYITEFVREVRRHYPAEQEREELCQPQ